MHDERNPETEPRMAVRETCDICGRAIAWGRGCIGPEITASILDKSALLRARLKTAGEGNAEIPRRQARRYREVRPTSDLYLHGDQYCGDCGAGMGQYHHLGCDLEVCPRCGEQTYSGCECP